MKAILLLELMCKYPLTRNFTSFLFDFNLIRQSMWDSISQKNYQYYAGSQNCLEPSTVVPSMTCSIADDCNDGSSCSDDSCNAGECINAINSNCCGNLVCEPYESLCSDCGPFRLDTPRCGWCSIFHDGDPITRVDALSNIILQSIGVQVYGFDIHNIVVRTSPDGLIWSNHSVAIVASGDIEFVTLDFGAIGLGDVEVNAGEWLYIRISTSQYITLRPFGEDPIARNDDLVLSNPFLSRSGASL